MLWRLVLRLYRLQSILEVDLLSVLLTAEAVYAVEAGAEAGSMERYLASKLPSRLHQSKIFKKHFLKKKQKLNFFVACLVERISSGEIFQCMLAISASSCNIQDRDSTISKTGFPCSQVNLSFFACWLSQLLPLISKTGFPYSQVNFLLVHAGYLSFFL